LEVAKPDVEGEGNQSVKAALSKSTWTEAQNSSFKRSQVCGQDSIDFCHAKNSVPLWGKGYIFAFIELHPYVVWVYDVPYTHRPKQGGATVRFCPYPLVLLYALNRFLADFHFLPH